MTELRVLFFGSTSDSVLVLEKLFTCTIQHSAVRIVAVVTQPPRPIGRKQVVTPTPVETWAKNHSLTVLSFPSQPEKPTLYQNEQTVTDTLQPLATDLLVSASYGQKIPWPTIQKARYGGLNVHPSILPRWRGADPMPWTILSGDHQTGVTIVTLSENFDEGKIIAQKKIPVTNTDLPDALRATLFSQGADLLIGALPDYISGNNQGNPQNPSNITFARRLTREDGFVPWELIQKAIAGENVLRVQWPTLFRLSEDSLAQTMKRALRALTPWPGLWTKVPIKGQDKRLKILRLSAAGDHLTIEEVQLEGKNPVPFTQFQAAYVR